MNTSHKGRRAEWKARRQLEACGYVVMRAAASKGVVDLVAWNATSIRLISVKCGMGRATATEREQLALMPRPTNATAELWTFRDRCRAPIVEQL